MHSSGGDLGVVVVTEQVQYAVNTVQSEFRLYAVLPLSAFAPGGINRKCDFAFQVAGPLFTQIKCEHVGGTFVSQVLLIHHGHFLIREHA